MSGTEEFIRSVGLTDLVKRWLADHHGDELREEIIDLLYRAIDEGCPREFIEPLRRLILKIPI